MTWTASLAPVMVRLAGTTGHGKPSTSDSKSGTRDGASGVTADTVPPEDAVRHGSITLANAVLPQRIRSAIADTIQL